MNELTPLLEKLATKLGTTVEMLWCVLLKQATISGATDLAIYASLVAITVWSFNFVQRKTTVPAPTEEERHPSAEWEDEGKVLSWIAVFVIAIISAGIIFSNVNNTVSSFLNPQYWALEQILSKVK